MVDVVEMSSTGLNSIDPSSIDRVEVVQGAASIIQEATKNFDKASEILKGLKSGGAYDDVLKVIIPRYCQTGKGGIPSPDAWQRNIIADKRATYFVSERLIQDFRAGDARFPNNFDLLGSPESINVVVV